MSSIVNHKEKLQWNSRREVMPLEKWLRNVKLFNVQWKSKIVTGCCLICSVSSGGKMLQLNKKASKILT